MKFTITIAALAVSAAALSVPKPNVVARALYPRQSSGACVDNSCPSTDNDGNALNTFTVAGIQLSCFYGAETCDYDNTTGGLLLGSDIVACPPTSLPGGCVFGRRMYRREDNFTAMQRKVEAAREAARARRAAPGQLAARNSMDKKQAGRA